MPNDVRPMEVRDVTFHASTRQPRGYSAGFGILQCNGVASWSIDAMVRGVPHQHADTGAVGLGAPVYTFQGDGEGESASHWHLAALCPDDPVMFMFVQVDYGATLQDLLGSGARSEFVTLPGVLGKALVPAALQGPLESKLQSAGAVNASLPARQPLEVPMRTGTSSRSLPH